MSVSFSSDISEQLRMGIREHHALLKLGGGLERDLGGHAQLQHGLLGRSREGGRPTASAHQERKCAEKQGQCQSQVRAEAAKTHIKCLHTLCFPKGQDFYMGEKKYTRINHLLTESGSKYN